jgi:hypothetical protein
MAPKGSRPGHFIGQRPEEFQRVGSQDGRLRGRGLRKATVQTWEQRENCEASIMSQSQWFHILGFINLGSDGGISLRRRLAISC